MNNFIDLSIKLTKTLNSDIKKNNGIFFTPSNIVIDNIKKIKDYIQEQKINIKDILEPSSGSGEFIIKIKENFNNVNIYAIEYTKYIYNIIKDNIIYENVNLYNEDFLKFTSQKKYDLIIGNPPYYVMSKKDVKSQYYKYFDGRPNIFCIFILKSLELLNNNGIISFVLPISFCNCIYYNKLRELLYNDYYIIDIVEYSNLFIETQQETITLIIQKKEKDNNDANESNKANNKKFSLYKNNILLLAPQQNIDKLKKLYENSTTLNSLGFNVSVGNIVWNQVKDILTNDNNKTLLLYDSNIVNKKIQIKEFSNLEKKQYINKSGKKELLLIIKRGYGKGKYNFNYAIIDDDKEYLLENHILYIEYNYKNNINKEQLLDLYKKITNSFDNDKTKKFIDFYFKNNGINTNELQNILPIYL